MALSQSTSLFSLLVPSHKHNLPTQSQNPRWLLLSTPETSRFPLISSSHTAAPLRIIISVAGASSDDGTRETSPFSTSISSVFVKGLPDSVSEGRLKKVFSEFGKVSNVKIMVNERTRQSLGYGYVWFNSKEDAQLAVETMNGKFFDGRFILVKFGQPVLSSRRRSGSDFLFCK